jgi:hypothetical protein
MQSKTAFRLHYHSIVLLCAIAAHATPIDRHALVTRHNVVLRQFDANNPLTVGNGGFAFTVDATGLQTFPEAFEQTIPLGTLSDWGWHTIPNPNGWSIDSFQFKEFADLNGRKVPCADVPGNNQTPEIKWRRANPHRLHLGQIGFILKPADAAAPAHVLSHSRRARSDAPYLALVYFPVNFPASVRCARRKVALASEAIMAPPFKSTEATTPGSPLVMVKTNVSLPLPDA